MVMSEQDRWPLQHTPTHCILCHTLSSVGEQRDVHLHLKQTEQCHVYTVNDGDWRGRAGLAQLMALSYRNNCQHTGTYINTYTVSTAIQHAHTPESGVLKVATAGGLLPYSFMACTDQLYCVLCWRLGRGREVAVMAEKVREVEVLVRVTL